MNWMERFSQALDELMHHKLRTSLTLLGMIFGVGAVVSMLNVGEGAQREALQLIDSMGVRNLIIKAKAMDEEELQEMREHSSGLSLRDVEAGMDSLPFVVDYAAWKAVKPYALFSKAGQSDGSVHGVTSSFLSMSRLEMHQGRPLLEIDDRTFSQVCVLGSKAALSLFPNGDALGNTVKVNHVWFRVVGVLKTRHLSKDEIQGVKLGGERNRVYVPLNTALKRFKFPRFSNELDEFRFQLDQGINPVTAAKTLSHLLDVRHGGMDDFEIIVPAALLDQQQQTQRIFTIVMSCVAGISLLVGGIGIMNIMLATVLERTREIGLRRALGATQHDILCQFMVESFTISVIGGVVGILLGLGLSLSIASFAKWQVAWSFGAIALSMGVCSAVGLIFGIYPALKAAKLDPIVALYRQ